MSSDPRYLSTQDLDSFFIDKSSGLPLAGGILTFYRDAARTVLKDVFQVTGSFPSYSYTPLPNPLTLSAVGTIQNAGGDNVDLLYFPYDEDGNLDLYYVVCTDSGGAEQFTRAPWPPGIGATSTPAQTETLTENQITNSNFTNILINSGQATTYTVTGTTTTFPLAPDWDFVISGTGTVVVQQIPIAGNSNIVTSPPFVLDVTVNGGITQCFLRQRFFVNSGLWASTPDQNVFLTGSFVAQNQAAGSVLIGMSYVESNGNPDFLIFKGSVTPLYQFLSGGNPLPVPLSTNVNSGSTGYVDIYLSFPSPCHVRISAIQVIPTTIAFDTLASPVPTDLNSSNRDEAFQGDYYIPRLNKKQINSFLTGWDFTVNPFQFGASGTINNGGKYIADQTIACVSTPATMNYGRDGMTNGLSVASQNLTNSFYVLQYLSGSSVDDMLGTSMSVNLFAYTRNAGTVTAEVRLFRAPAAVAIPTLTTTIGQFAFGVFTLTAPGWTEIPRSNLPLAVGTLNTVPVGSESAINNGKSDLGFSGWQITNSAELADTDKFAIVVVFNVFPLATVCINSISLIPGDLPCRPSIQSPDEVLRKCQYYYQKSFIGSTVAAFAVGQNTGESSGTQAAPSNTACTGPVIRFYTTMRTTPSVAIYNPVTAASTTIRDPTTGNDWAACLPIYISSQGFTASGTTPVTSAAGNACTVHWDAKAMLGFI